MMDKLIISALWMVFLTVVLLNVATWYESEQLNRGKAISRFIAYYHDIDMTPQDARWLVPVVTTYNITLEELNVLPAYAPIERD